MAVQNFVIELIEDLLNDKELSLTERNIRFYDRGTTPDENMEAHIRWKNARFYNDNSNVVRSSILVIQLNLAEMEAHPEVDQRAEYVNFNVGDLYRMYRKGGLEAVRPVIKENIRILKTTAAHNMSVLQKYGDYEATKNNLILRPLNYDNNERVLTDCVYQQIGDIALVLYLSLGSIKQENGSKIMSAMVRREAFEQWNVSEEEVLDWALRNTMRLQAPIFCYITGLQLDDLCTGDIAAHASNFKTRQVRFMDDENVVVDLNDITAPVLTTEQQVNGAIAAFYPGVLDRIRKIAGGDFYLVFTGTSDVHIHPVSSPLSLSRMKRTLDEMNRELNTREELLSRHIYRYNGETKQIVSVK